MEQIELAQLNAEFESSLDVSIFLSDRLEPPTTKLGTPICPRDVQNKLVLLLREYYTNVCQSSRAFLRFPEIWL